MPVLAHETEAMNEDWPIGGKRVDQVGKVLPFYYAELFQPRYRVIPYPERLLLNPGEPMLKAEKIERILFASVYQDDRTRRLQLSATPAQRARESVEARRVPRSTAIREEK